MTCSDDILVAMQVVITAAQGGHSAPVKALLPFNKFLISADLKGTMKVWDMASGQCVQTIQQAHTHAIMGLLNWEVCQTVLYPCGMACFFIISP